METDRGILSIPSLNDLSPNFLLTFFLNCGHFFFTFYPCTFFPCTFLSALEKKLNIFFEKLLGRKFFEDKKRSQIENSYKIFEKQG